MAAILDLFNDSITAVVSWWVSIMDSSGAGMFYVSQMMVVLTVSILLGPLLGSMRSSSSDKSDPRRKTDEGDDK